MKILVTGARGQLGREVVSGFEKTGYNVIGVGRKELDLSRPETVVERVASFEADWVVNCAAYTQVDKAENEPELAFTINRDGAKAIAEGIRKAGGRMLHLSTDFLFDGKQSTPYREDDEPKPLSVYGHSKWQGEQVVQEILPDAIVLRTAWVYGVYGQNFVRTILRLAAEREQLQVVDDQVGSPSWTRDIATTIQTLIEAGQPGTLNYTNEGIASWYDFALQTIEYARELGFPVKVLELSPIPSRQYPLPATRPSYSVLSKEKVRPLLRQKNPHWRASLYNMLKQLKHYNDQMDAIEHR